MESDLTIQLKVLTQGLEKLTQAQTQVSNLDNALNKASGGGISKFGKMLESTGSRINVLGQRLTFMASLPLVAFGNSAVNVAVEVERSFTRLNKVFSGTGEELGQLRTVAFDLSTSFGKPVEEVIQVLTEFNKAGVDSVEDLQTLGKVVAQTSILFDTDLTSAMEGTKSVMMGFNLTAKETEGALAAINIIADKTTASEQGILDVFNRAAGTAREAGLSFRELAASQAVFEKNAIPAGRAGNAMKSILVSLTKQSDLAKGQFLEFGINMGVDVSNGVSKASGNVGELNDKLKIAQQRLKEAKKSGDAKKSTIMSLNNQIENYKEKIDKAGSSTGTFNKAMAKVDISGDQWRSAEAGKKLEILAKKFLEVQQSGDKLKRADFNEAMASLVGKFQINNLTVLLEDLSAEFDNNADTISQYAEALRVSADDTENMKFQIQQLDKALESSPMKLDILEQKYRKQQIILGNELIPLKVKFMETLIKILEAYNNLSPAMKEWVTNVGIGVVILGPFLAALGLITSGLGVFLQLIRMIAIFLAGSFQVAMKAATLATNVFRLALLSIPLSLVITIGVASIVAAIKKAYELNDAMNKLKGTNEEAAKSIQKLVDKARSLDKDDPNRKRLLEAASRSSAGVVSAQNQLVEDLKWKNLLGFATGGVIPGSYSQATPIMAHGSEMVLNPSQQRNLFDMISGRNSGSKGGVEVNIRVGTMVATPGEQREFARKIKNLLEQDAGRFATQ